MAKSSRSAARERKKQREAERKRNRQMTIVGAVVAVVVVLGLLFLLSNLPSEAPIDAELVDRYDNYRTSQTEEGYFVLGNADAPADVVEFSSFSCPACENFHRNSFDDLLPLIEEGLMKFTYVPLQTGSIPNQAGSARAAICAGEQGKFFEMHDVLFDFHSVYGNQAFTGNRLEAAADGLGLDVGDFNRCFNSATTDEILDNAQREGVGSTPTIRVNGVDTAASADAIITAVREIAGGQDVESGLIDPTLADEVEEVVATEEAVDTEEEVMATEEVVVTEEADSDE